MWVIFSLLASILWGLEYTLTERVLQSIRLPTLLTLEMLFGFFAMLGLGLATGSYNDDLVLLTRSRSLVALVVLIAILFNLANAFIVLSIGSKSATLSGLIEISYPLFVALFSWWLLRENSLIVFTAVGATLIVLGILLVYASNS
jgi:drug/metabolite transporter (DMT)-like permease